MWLIITHSPLHYQFVTTFKLVSLSLELQKIQFTLHLAQGPQKHIC